MQHFLCPSSFQTPHFLFGQDSPVPCTQLHLPGAFAPEVQAHPLQPLPVLSTEASGAFSFTPSVPTEGVGPGNTLLPGPANHDEPGSAQNVQFLAISLRLVGPQD